MDVSIVIPTKNAGKSFDKVLKTIFEQKTEYKFEVICVDSGSKDNTISIIKKYPCKLYEIKSEDFGHGKTRNYGASKGTGEFIVFITQDALPYNEYWLDNFIKAMKLDDNIAGGFGVHYPYPNCNLIDKGMLERHFKGFGDKTTIYSMNDDKERYEKEEGYRQFIVFFSDNNACLRRSVWERYNYPDVDFAEDQIWMRQMIEAGYKKVYAKDAGVYHSHNYDMKTYEKRYFDEYKGIYQIHKYIMASNYKDLLKAYLREVKQDYIYIRSLDISKSKKIYWIIYSMRRNKRKCLGAYKAGKYCNLNEQEKQAVDKKYSQQLEQRTR